METNLCHFKENKKDELTRNEGVLDHSNQALVAHGTLWIADSPKVGSTISRGWVGIHNIQFIQ